MKIFLLSPNAGTIFTAEQRRKLAKAGDLVLERKRIPFNRVKGLMVGDEDRILAIDPDFCDWKVPNKAIDQIPKLRAVVLQTTSFSWVDVDYLG